MCRGVLRSVGFLGHALGFCVLVGRMRGGALSPKIWWLGGVHARSLPRLLRPGRCWRSLVSVLPGGVCVQSRWKVCRGCRGCCALVGVEGFWSIFLGCVLSGGMHVQSLLEGSPWLPRLLRPCRCWGSCWFCSEGWWARCNGLGCGCMWVWCVCLGCWVQVGSWPFSWIWWFPVGFARVPESWGASSGCLGGNV